MNQLLIKKRVVYGKNLSAKRWKVTGRLVIRHSISWLFEKFLGIYYGIDESYIFEAMDIRSL